MQRCRMQYDQDYGQLEYRFRQLTNDFQGLQLECGKKEEENDRLISQLPACSVCKTSFNESRRNNIDVFVKLSCYNYLPF